MHGYISVEEELVKFFRDRIPKTFWLPKVGTYFPSVLVRRCPKDAWNYYRITEREGQFPDSFLLHTHEGKAWHAILDKLRDPENPKRSLWSATELVGQKRVRLPNGEYITIRGRCDAVRGDTVYEFKRRSFIPYKPAWADLFQLNFYCEVLGKPKGKLVVLGYRNNQFTVVEYDHTLTDWMTGVLLEKAQNLHNALRHNEPPMCTCRNKVHDVEWTKFVIQQKKWEHYKKRRR